MTLELVAYLLIGVSSVFLTWLYLVAFRDFYDEKTRQSLFNIRNYLWDLAHNGKEGDPNSLDPNSDAYILLRTTLNGYLRYVHRLSLFQLFIMAAWYSITRRDLENPYEAEFLKALERVPSKERKLLEYVQQQLKLVIYLHLAECSWFLRPIIWAIPALRHYRRIRSAASAFMELLTQKAHLNANARIEGLRCAT